MESSGTSMGGGLPIEGIAKDRIELMAPFGAPTAVRRLRGSITGSDFQIH